MFPQTHGEITVRTCQGIGDIFWVWQKLTPYFDKINFSILAMNHSPSSGRALEWLKFWPKVGNVTLEMTDDAVYRTAATQCWHLADVLGSWAANAKTPVMYSCNRWLELGVNLDDIDPGSRVERDLPLTVAEVPNPYPHYLLVFISERTLDRHVTGDTSLNVWSVDRWADFLTLAHRGSKLPLVLFGAGFDIALSERLAPMLERAGVVYTTAIGLPPDQAMGLINQCAGFIGYQSGLSIIADYLNVPQLMIYFTYLRPMMYTWCRPQNARTLLQAITFDEGMPTALERCQRLRLRSP